jgi:hypothetical protein
MKRLRLKRRNSPYIFHVVASLPTKAFQIYLISRDQGLLRKYFYYMYKFSASPSELLGVIVSTLWHYRIELKYMIFNIARCYIDQLHVSSIKRSYTAMVSCFVFK